MYLRPKDSFVEIGDSEDGSSFIFPFEAFISPFGWLIADDAFFRVAIDRGFVCSFRLISDSVIRLESMFPFIDIH